VHRFWFLDSRQERQMAQRFGLRRRQNLDILTEEYRKNLEIWPRPAGGGVACCEWPRIMVGSQRRGALTMNTFRSAWSPRELERYSRHFILPELGADGQEKLCRGSVLIVGVGGLGSPAALYLAAAGVGRIGLIDPDVVSLSNLHRQILYDERDLGERKVRAAARKLEQVNSDITVIPFEAKLTAENAREVIGAFDLVLDGSDNFATRYLVNDACVFLKKPLVSASLFRFWGQVSVFDARRGPCYRCLYPEPPGPEEVPDCAEAGILGVLPGVVGSLQALEVIKLLAKLGEPLIGWLLLFDGLKVTIRKVKVEKDPNCPLCGPSPTITDFVDYDHFCSAWPAFLEEPDPELEITPAELKKMLDRGDDVLLVDVRQPHERKICRLDPSLAIPFGELEQRLEELPRERMLVVYCHHGKKSWQAVQWLKKHGFSRVKNLRGGILAWAKEVEPSMPVY